MPTFEPSIDRVGLEVATRALCEQLGVEAKEQCAYLRCFPDGRVSMELEWVDTASLARVAVLAYLEAIRRRHAQQ
jgi:hypothetical protein